ncbi:MAG: sulfite exporter TauE/SafE family protein [Spirochaetales bacterium]|nr:sulfite exporter TauE/SafE family protein [Spirochaetales bacterium]
MVVVALVSLAIGILVGWCGVSGFFLPILFMDYCHFGAEESRLISFACFAISGVIGAYGYYRKGFVKTEYATKLCLGSIVGGIIGALVSNRIPSIYVKILLYIVVLVSGASIFLQILFLKERKREVDTRLLFPIGVVTAIICSLSGAGGPVIVMPVLMLLGFSPKDAVGTALLDMIFIALPVCAANAGCLPDILPVFLLAFIAHGVGMAVGTRTSSLIRPMPLKVSIAAFSILFAIYMLLKLGGLL